MKKCMAITWMLLFSIFGSFAQNYNLIEQFGSSGDDIGYTVLSSDNSIYVAGWF